MTKINSRVDMYGRKEFFKETSFGYIYYTADDNGMYFKVRKDMGKFYNTACFKNRYDALKFLKHAVKNNEYTPNHESIENANVLMWCCGF